MQVFELVELGSRVLAVNFVDEEVPAFVLGFRVADDISPQKRLEPHALPTRAERVLLAQLLELAHSVSPEGVILAPLSQREEVGKMLHVEVEAALYLVKVTLVGSDRSEEHTSELQ